jgi:hypothetical protein
MYVSVAIVRAILDELVRQGLPKASLLEAVGARPGLLSDPGGKIRVTDYAHIVQEALALAPTPGLGLAAGWRAKTSPEHIVGFVLVNSRTLRDAIHLYHRYAPLMFQDGVWLVAESGDEARFGFAHPHMWGPVAQCESELVLSFALSRFRRHFLGQHAPMREVRFQHEAPESQALYERVFQCPVRFGASTNEVVFDRTYLDAARLRRFDDAPALPWEAPKSRRRRRPARAVEVPVFSAPEAGMTLV